jgi:hypothetical protein
MRERLRRQCTHAAACRWRAGRRCRYAPPWTSKCSNAALKARRLSSSLSRIAPVVTQAARRACVRGAGQGNRLEGRGRGVHAKRRRIGDASRRTNCQFVNALGHSGCGKPDMQTCACSVAFWRVVPTFAIEYDCLERCTRLDCCPPRHGRPLADADSRGQRSDSRFPVQNARIHGMMGFR